MSVNRGRMGWGKELLGATSSSPASNLPQPGLVFLICKLDALVPTWESAIVDTLCQGTQPSTQ